MATKTIISSATFTLVNGTDIAFSDSEAVKAVGQYDHYQNIHATDDNSVEQRFPITAIASVSVTTDTETVDMTDNFCKEETECVLTVPTSNGNICFTSWSCAQGDGGYYAYLSADSELVAGDEYNYSMAVGGETIEGTATVIQGRDNIHLEIGEDEISCLTFPDSGTTVFFPSTTDAETCEEAIANASEYLESLNLTLQLATE